MTVEISRRVVIDLYNKGIAYRKIAETVGISQSDVTNVINSLIREGSIKPNRKNRIKLVD